MHSELSEQLRTLHLKVGEVHAEALPGLFQELEKIRSQADALPAHIQADLKDEIANADRKLGTAVEAFSTPAKAQRAPSLTPRELALTKIDGTVANLAKSIEQAVSGDHFSQAKADQLSRAVSQTRAELHGADLPQHERHRLEHEIDQAHDTLKAGISAWLSPAPQHAGAANAATKTLRTTIDSLNAFTEEHATAIFGGAAIGSQGREQMNLQLSTMLAHLQEVDMAHLNSQQQKQMKDAFAQIGRLAEKLDLD